MLSSIGRAAVRRVVAGTAQPSVNRALQSLFSIQRAGNLNIANHTQAHVPSYQSYATASKPKSRAAAAKPKAKKTVTKSATTKKAPPKKSAAKKVKPVKKVAKKAAAPKKKKVLTPEQKEKASEKKALEKAKIALKELKATALLDQPKTLPTTAYKVFLVEEVKGKSGTEVKDLFATAAKTFKTFSPEQLEHYNHKANENKAANEIAFKKWVESHTPDQIREANNARHSLKRRGLKVPSPVNIEDARLPKKPVRALGFFTKERWASGDLKGLKVPEASKLIAGEWKDISASARKSYEDQAAADSQRYEQEFKTVFKRVAAKKTA